MSLLQESAAAGVCLGSTHAAGEARGVIAQCPRSEEAVVAVQLCLGSAAAGVWRSASCGEEQRWYCSEAAAVLLACTHAASEARDIIAQFPRNQEAAVVLQQWHGSAAAGVRLRAGYCELRLWRSSVAVFLLLAAESGGGS